MTQAEPPRRAAAPNQLLIDLGPVAVFVVAFNVLQRIEATKASAVFIATGIFIVAVLAAILYCRLTRGAIPPVLIVTGVLVVAFGGLTLLLRDENFIKLKPTFVNLFYAVAIVGSVLIKQNVWRLLFRHAFVLPDKVWDVLAWRWAGFFLFLAALNEFIRLTQSTEFWVNSRLLIVFPLIFLFGLINAPLVMKHMPDADKKSDGASET